MTWRVAVECITYNHSAYIIDALKGFVSQNTNFPFVVCVIDDCSQDGEQEIIKKFVCTNCSNKTVVCDSEDAVIISCNSKDNSNLSFVFVLLKYNHYSVNKSKLPYIEKWISNSEFIAVCEGDDYWIDSQKLQMQVDFLGTNPEYGLVRTEVNARVEHNSTVIENFFAVKYHKLIDNTFKDAILNGWFTAPCTWMYRTSLRNYPKLDSKKYFSGDMLLQLHIMSQSKMHYIEKTTAVYRILPMSASHGLSVTQRLAFWTKNKNTRMYYAKSLEMGFKLKFVVNAFFVRWRCFKFNSVAYKTMFQDLVFNIKYLF